MAKAWITNFSLCLDLSMSQTLLLRLNAFGKAEIATKAFNSQYIVEYQLK